MIYLSELQFKTVYSFPRLFSPKATHQNEIKKPTPALKTTNNTAGDHETAKNLKHHEILIKVAWCGLSRNCHERTCARTLLECIPPQLEHLRVPSKLIEPGGLTRLGSCSSNLYTFFKVSKAHTCTMILTLKIRVYSWHAFCH